jgi:hypothetical protein
LTRISWPSSGPACWAGNRGRSCRATGERHDYAEGVVVVMADPEENEFCLVKYFA